MTDRCPFCGWHVDVTPDHCPRCFHGDPPEEPQQKSGWSWLEGVEPLFEFALILPKAILAVVVLGAMAYLWFRDLFGLG